MKSDPVIQFKRAEPPNERDFLVLIDGEHRATFRSNARYSRAGYDFRAADGKSIAYRLRSQMYSPITRADFAEIVQRCLVDIPTLADIERGNMIDQAEHENREWDIAQSKRRFQVKRDVLVDALNLYLQHYPTADAEHRNMAQEVVARYTAPDFQGWF